MNQTLEAAIVAGAELDDIKVRTKEELYPKYTAEIRAIQENGITPELLSRIIKKHLPNARYNKKLYERYQVIASGVPIFSRQPRFQEGNDVINNTVNNDFFSEIIDFKVGYFAGVPVAYSYSDTKEAKEDTAGNGATIAEAEEARDRASKALSDFVTRNNMFDVDMETTKYASICGYSGRLMYHDIDGNERVMPVAPFETIILSETDEVAEPTYAVRYYNEKNIDGEEYMVAEFYDESTIRFFKGSVGSLVEEPEKEKLNLYGYCPLQGIANNKELLGDAEKVLELIDAYDRAVSDSSNEVESFANAYMVFENIQISDDEMRKAQVSGSIQFRSSSNAAGKVYFLTKDNNGTFVENHLKRVQENIYKFSKTPNLSDSAFGTSSGVALKFKLTGLESKCGMFQAKCITANNYMFKLWGYAMSKKQIKVDPLQCVCEFKRNFPLDLLSEAQAAQAMIAAGIPKRIAFQLAFSAIDDIDYVMQLIEDEMNGIPDLYETTPEDTVQEEETTDQEQTNETAVTVKEDETLAT